MSSRPISAKNWNRLVAANKAAVEANWAQPGIFGTAVGPDFPIGGNGVFYIGKSAGPLGERVGSSFGQVQSAKASTRWMIDRLNKSAFWQLIDRVDRTRRTLAWSNVSKMDRLGGGVPPKAYEWAQIRVECLDALSDEIEYLEPAVTLFATSDYLRADVVSVLLRLGFVQRRSPIEDGLTSLFVRAGGMHAVMTRHPQGWPVANCDAVAELVMSLAGKPHG